MVHCVFFLYVKKYYPLREYFLEIEREKTNHGEVFLESVGGKQKHYCVENSSKSHVGNLDDLMLKHYKTLLETCIACVTKNPIKLPFCKFSSLLFLWQCSTSEC